MADRVQIKRGLKEYLPTTALEGEMLLCTDTRELYVGVNGKVEPIAIESDAFITSEVPVPNDIGGIKKGTIFNQTSITDILFNLIFPYTTPEVNITTNQASLIETGARLTGTTCTIKILKRMYDVKSVKLYKANRLLQTWENLSVNFTTPITLTYSDGAILTGNTIYTVEVEDEKKTTTALRKIDFELPVFLGVCAAGTPTATEINTATKSVKYKASLSHTFTTNNQRMMFVYPYTWGELKTIKDINQFDITNTFSKASISHTTSAGSNKYFVYVSNITTVKKFKIDFNF